MNRTVITVIGKDRVGIIARVCTFLSENNINILDINQSIVQGFFNMMMIADNTNSSKEFDQCQKELGQIGEELGVQVKCQKEAIFEMMHRI